MTKEEYKKMIVDSMKENGDYNEGYDPVIDALTNLQELARDAYEQTKAHPEVYVTHTDENGNTRMILSPVWSVFIDLQHSVAVYLGMLGLGAK